METGQNYTCNAVDNYISRNAMYFQNNSNTFLVLIPHNLSCKSKSVNAIHDVVINLIILTFLRSQRYMHVLAYTCRCYTEMFTGLMTRTLTLIMKPPCYQRCWFPSGWTLTWMDRSWEIPSHGIRMVCIATCIININRLLITRIFHTTENIKVPYSCIWQQVGHQNWWSVK